MAKIKKIKLPNNAAYDVVDAGAVRYDEAQALTDEQKAIVRDNIGIGEIKPADIGLESANVFAIATIS